MGSTVCCHPDINKEVVETIDEYDSTVADKGQGGYPIQRMCECPAAILGLIGAAMQRFFPHVQEDEKQLVEMLNLSIVNLTKNPAAEGSHLNALLNACRDFNVLQQSVVEPNLDALIQDAGSGNKLAMIDVLLKHARPEIVVKRLIEAVKEQGEVWKHIMDAVFSKHSE